jgi:hypothetical protein
VDRIVYSCYEFLGKFYSSVNLSWWWSQSWYKRLIQGVPGSFDRSSSFTPEEETGWSLCDSHIHCLLSMFLFVVQRKSTEAREEFWTRRKRETEEGAVNCSVLRTRRQERFVLKKIILYLLFEKERLLGHKNNRGNTFWKSFYGHRRRLKDSWHDLLSVWFVLWEQWYQGSNTKLRPEQWSGQQKCLFVTHVSFDEHSSARIAVIHFLWILIPEETFLLLIFTVNWHSNKNIMKKSY